MFNPKNAGRQGFESAVYGARDFAEILRWIIAFALYEGDYAANRRIASWTENGSACPACSWVELWVKFRKRMAELPDSVYHQLDELFGCHEATNPVEMARKMLAILEPPIS